VSPPGCKSGVKSSHHIELGYGSVSRSGGNMYPKWMRGHAAVSGMQLILEAVGKHCGIPLCRRYWTGSKQRETRGGWSSHFGGRATLQLRDCDGRAGWLGGSPYCVFALKWRPIVSQTGNELHAGLTSIAINAIDKSNQWHDRRESRREARVPIHSGGIWPIVCLPMPSELGLLIRHVQYILRCGSFPPSPFFQALTPAFTTARLHPET